MAVAAPNPLLSTGRASDSSLAVKLHPLVLLTISDYITRHTLVKKEGPIIGAVVGQQNGREITMEHAFECKVQADEQGRIVMDNDWFAARIEQYKDVHKAPALDLVAVFTLGSPSGPLPEHVPIVQQIQHAYNDSLILVLFHPSIILDGELAGGKLPISLYESYYEPGSEPADKGLQVDGWGQGQQLQMRFRELSFEVETGEAEMIGIDFVAKGSGNASAIANAAPTQKTGSKKGKAKAQDEETNGVHKSPLTSEEDELIASLTGKANAIKMLHARVDLIKSYLHSLPPSYLTDGTIPVGTSDSTPLNHALLRNISSLLSRLPLLSPPSMTADSITSSAARPSTASSFSQGSAHSTSDVHLVSLLSSLTRTVSEAREFGKKSSIVMHAKHDRRMTALARGEVMGGGGRMGMMDQFGTRGGDDDSGILED